MEDLTLSEIIEKKASDRIQESIPKPEELRDFSYEELASMPKEQKVKLFWRNF